MVVVDEENFSFIPILAWRAGPVKKRVFVFHRFPDPGPHKQCVHDILSCQGTKRSQIPRVTVVSQFYNGRSTVMALITVSLSLE